MFPASSATSPWGRHALSFALPMVELRLQGLSTTQRDALSRTYPGFVRLVAPDAENNGPACRTYRLPRALTVSSELLTDNGQYAPRKVKRDETVELTGVNFQATIDVSGPGGDSTLGVANEDELPLCNVIENFLRVYTAHHALRQGGVILHSAGLVFDDLAYIFVGRSNAGKTTLTRKAYRQGARILSDDINLVLPDRASYRAHAVPFTGEFGRTLNPPGDSKSYPVAGITLLQQGECLAVRRVRASEAVARLLVGCPFVNTGTDETNALFDVLSELAGNVPVLSLDSRREDSITDIMNAVKSSIGHA